MQTKNSNRDCLTPVEQPSGTTPVGDAEPNADGRVDGRTAQLKAEAVLNLENALLESDGNVFI